MKVGADGLDGIQRDIGALAANLDDRLVQGNADLASEVVSTARGIASGVGQMQVRAAAELRPGKDAKGGRVELQASVRVPYALGAEFGAAQDRERQRKTGRYIGLRGFLRWNRGGYFLYPAIRANDPEAVALDALDDVLRELG